MQNLTRYDLANSCDSGCKCHMMEQPEGVYVKFYDIEKILTAHNTGSPKLPLFEEIWNTLKHEIYNPSDNLGGVEYLIKGQAERVYEFIERQLRASA